MTDKRWKALLMAALMAVSVAAPVKVQAAEDNTVTLRVCSWEEYIDEGGWEPEERIELPSGDVLEINRWLRILKTGIIRRMESW